MEFRVLGPIEVHAGDGTVRLPGLKGRMLLARLLVDADRAVSVDALADALWADSAPVNVANSLQANVSKLRRAFEAHVGEALALTTLATHGAGYVLRLDGHTYDARVAAELVADSREALRQAQPERALAVARQALDLYRGEPLAEVAYLDWAQAEAHRLAELQLDATEAIHAAQLELGRHAEAITPLQALVAVHPFRERLLGLLMLALYRAGRQADALRCYSTARRQLIDELGIEPGSELRELEARILGQDPTLARREATTVPDREQRMVGRAAERSALQGALARATAGGTQVVLAFGEPGVGKTALADWLADEAIASGSIVAHGRAPAVGGAPLYWPWTEALRSIVQRYPELTSATSQADLDVLAKLVPGLDGAVRASSETSPIVLYDAVARFLAAAGSRSPVVVLLDDLHWADDATIDLFGFVARARTQARLLVVGLARPDMPGGHPLRTLASDLVTQPGANRLTLSGLDVAEVGELVTRLSGSSPDPRLAAVLRERTGGNPFFITEIVRNAVDDGGRLNLSLVAVPGTVSDVTRSRVRRLGPYAEDIFTVLSFARDSFTTVLADRLAEVPSDRVAAVVEAGVVAGLLVEVPGRPGVYRFAHNLVRHVFYDELTAGRRAETHLRVGRVLEDVVPRPDEIANVLAWHYTNAATVGGAERAVHWERVAARNAIAALAHSDAVHHLRRALASVRRVLRDDGLECVVLAELADAARLAGDEDTASTAERRIATLTAQPQTSA